MPYMRKTKRNGTARVAMPGQIGATIMEEKTTRTGITLAKGENMPGHNRNIHLEIPKLESGYKTREFF